MSQGVCIVGYSGHAYVVCDILQKQGYEVEAYCEKNPKETNSLQLKYLGFEQEKDVLQELKGYHYFVAIGDNDLRGKTMNYLMDTLDVPLNAIHPNAIVGKNVNYGRGIMVAANATINPKTKVERGVICNTGAIVEHECEIHTYAHIGPGTILLGNVGVGAYTLVGGNAVINPGIKIGAHCIIGSGSVVNQHIPAYSKAYGNPVKILKNGS